MTEENRVENDELQNNDQNNDQPEEETLTAEKSSGRFFKRLMWLVILVAIAAAAYWGYTRFPALFNADAEQVVEQPRQDPIDARFNQLERSVANLEQQLQSTVQARELDKFSNTDQQLQREFTNLRQSLEDLRDDVRKTPAEKAAYWRLVEIKQTLSAAARMMWSQEDYKAALRLLKLADQQLVGIDNRDAIRTREKLAGDIERVNAIVEADNTDLALQLVGLQQRVADLPDKVNNNQQRLSSDTQAVSDDVNDWQTNLSANWQSFLDNFIRIQPVESDPEPLLNVTQRTAINERIQLTFTLAQQAAVKNNEQLWQRYLEQLSKLILEVKGDKAATQDVVSRIQALSREDFEEQSLDQLESLDFIAQTIEQGDAS
ncbi:MULTISPECIES: uroporphyrinogen-III C-methyltransferase [Idiomarina]|uniref:Uroporphyrinogen-III C-methyltransferase n=1 Tax=Idiomarina abyssalis TaxID=86102 RepID=A0A8I1G923_9GAMM|nr:MULTISPECIES: uroporphyrinogen-III C-methyltransferase [Idiomarina]KPD21038.1 regulator of HemA biosynthesis [Idiomarina abyssalis]MAO67135.1 regulator of HemA biosynthesis [Idiomarina sp.]MBF80257.1 regulator of HemA biosynthesis [Idiomarina sp.]MBJ7267546.1 uroporphyrinogen-III C-methyltransferase [Idiomarina abyssalis]MBJ7273909.1 uroporphyrinogen-III C-methyltransferase [Idiomarina abyssalis]|tara:strand:+ start:131001 stop:132125 length:1125 start_codon:yes stop_codon:yes gene_type:complete